MSIFHNLKAKFKKPKVVEKLEIIDENCIGCGKCIKMCKREVFELQNKKAVVVNSAACVGCGKCIEKMCKFGAITLQIAK
ncbi:MAG: 4Fe-4S binding protein [Rikenellaceae bacterium]